MIKMEGDLTDEVEMHDICVLYSIVRKGEAVSLLTREPSTAHIVSVYNNILLLCLSD